jgi:hypothetical protein
VATVPNIDLENMPVAKRKRGSGSLYHPKYLDRYGEKKDVATWWFKYCVRGKVHCETSRSTDRAVAERMLDERIAARDKIEARRRAKRAAQRMEVFEDLPLIDLLSHSVRTLVAELRRLGQPVPAVYFLKSSEFIKIGYAADFEARLRELQTGNPVELELLGLLPGPRSLEYTIHAAFRDERERGEWFRLEGRLAQFLTSLKLIYESRSLFHPTLNEISDNGRC